MKEHGNKRHNKYDLSGEYGIGYTSKGEEFYFDLEDYDKIYPYCWVVSSSTKAVVARNPETGKLIALHRLVMGFPDGKQIDHIHHKRYDNRKSELRICTNQQNSLNQVIQKNNTSGHPGISWCEKDKLWHAYIQINGHRISKCFHKNELDVAVQWRKSKEKELFGEFMYNE